MLRGFLSGTLRREMRARTEEILKSVKGLTSEFKKNTRLLSGIAGLQIEEVFKSELKESMGRIAQSEKALDTALHQHIEFLEKLLKEWAT